MSPALLAQPCPILLTGGGPTAVGPSGADGGPGLSFWDKKNADRASAANAMKKIPTPKKKCRASFALPLLFFSCSNVPVGETTQGETRRAPLDAVRAVSLDPTHLWLSVSQVSVSRPNPPSAASCLTNRPNSAPTTTRPSSSPSSRRPILTSSSLTPIRFCAVSHRRQPQPR
jgi:hypothetical protein